MNENERRCTWCSEPIQGHPTKKYCDYRCSNNAWRKAQARLCGCGCGERTSSPTREFLVGHRPKTPAEDRFWTKVDKSGDCWLWAAHVDPGTGYGKFGIGGQMVLAHRYSLHISGVEIGEGLHVDHLCRVRRCVRPDHLEPVTQAENIRRGVPFRKVKTHCPQGHAFADHGFTNSAGNQECRACRRMRARKSRRVARAA